MKAKRLDRDGARTWAIIFDSGDEVASGLGEFAKREGLTASALTAIGAFESVTLGYFQIDEQSYKRIEIDEQVEVVSMVGDVSVSDGKPEVHAHLVVAKSDGSAHGGHLLDGRVRPTLEVILTELPDTLRRTFRPEFGLALIDPDASP